MKEFRMPTWLVQRIDQFTGVTFTYNGPQCVEVLDLQDLERWHRDHRALDEELALGHCPDCIRAGEEMLRISRDIAAGHPAPPRGGQYWMKIPMTDAWFGFMRPEELWEEFRVTMEWREMIGRNPAWHHNAVVRNGKVILTPRFDIN